jgi:hypothetical protein
MQAYTSWEKTSGGLTTTELDCKCRSLPEGVSRTLESHQLLPEVCGILQ